MQNQDQTIKQKIIIPDKCQGMRLDQALAGLLPDFSRSRLQKWLVDGQILLDGQHVNAKTKVAGGETIVLDVTITEQVRWEAQDIPLTIIYQDEALAIINKPAGLVAHPAAGNSDNTLVNALLHHIPETRSLSRAGIVHRLDKDTSGLLVVAKSLTAHHFLTKALQARKIHREYACIVSGTFISGGTIDVPIGRHPRNRLKQAVIESGKPAKTHYRLIEKFKDYTYLKVILDTGRTHQIRVHMTHIGHPLIGDPLYGGRPKIPKNLSPALKATIQNFNRQALHARKLILVNPLTNQEQTFTADLPDDFQLLLDALRNQT